MTICVDASSQEEGCNGLLLRRLTLCIGAIFCVCILGEVFSGMAAVADTLKITAWNIEHLRDETREPPSRRTGGDYQRLQQHAQRLGADVIAVQEVENERALARVFDPARYNFFVSNRNDTLRTGFAVRKSISVKRHPDLRSLNTSGRLRHGVDVEISIGGRHIRLLSVHLKAFCFMDSVAAPQKSDCKKLAKQIPALERWIDDRAAEGTPLVVLGDFNRRFDAPDEDFWPLIDDRDPEQLRLFRVTEGVSAKCNGGKYPVFIDHIVYDRLIARWIVPGSFEELVYTGPSLSDHCPISVTLDVRR